jgi:hypothetical protein
MNNVDDTYVIMRGYNLVIFIDDLDVITEVIKNILMHHRITLLVHVDYIIMELNYQKLVMANFSIILSIKIIKKLIKLYYFNSY